MLPHLLAWTALVCLGLPDLSLANSGNVDVWLTVSSLATKATVNGNKQVVQRLLELNWRNAPATDGDWIGLFKGETIGSHLTPEMAASKTNADRAVGGHYTTGIQFPIFDFNQTDTVARCLGYWIAYVQGTRVMASSCMRTQPTWMGDHMEYIGNKMLKDVMLPGTHNSGSYTRGYGPSSGSWLMKYGLCQDENVFNQLVYGIRYLDLRVSYQSVKNSKENLWIVHSFLRMEVTLDSVLRQVKAFLDATKEEVVILDFHRFEKGFDEKAEKEDEIVRRHNEVVALVESHLKDHMAANANGYYKRVGELIGEKRRLVVGYAGYKYTRSSYLYPRVRHLWAETDTTRGLEEFFSNNVCGLYSYEAQSAMAQLTPKKLGVALDRYGGLRKLAQEVNSQVTAWFRDRWWRCANIISTDFFLGNNLVQVAIDSNRRRKVELSRTLRSIRSFAQLFGLKID